LVEPRIILGVSAVDERSSKTCGSNGYSETIDHLEELRLLEGGRGRAGRAGYAIKRLTPNA